MTVDGSAANLSADVSLGGICKADSPSPIVLDTAFTLGATNPVALQELTLVVLYKIA